MTKHLLSIFDDDYICSDETYADSSVRGSTSSQGFGSVHMSSTDQETHVSEVCMPFVNTYKRGGGDALVGEI